MKSLINRIYKYCRSREGSDRLITVMLVLLIVLLFVMALTVSAHADGIHLNQMYDQFGSIIAGPSWVEIGAVICVDNNGKPKWFLLKKGGGISHDKIHVIPLTEDEAKQLKLMEIVR